jgi:HSP20 family protein
MFERFLPSLRKREKEVARREDDFFNLVDEFIKAPFAGFPLAGGAAEGRMIPAVDVRDGEREIVVTAELPGLEPKDVELRLEHEALVIKGEKKYECEDKKDCLHRRERRYGAFTRVIPLPSAVKAEEIKAVYKNGVLTVTLPKDEKAQPKRIEIQ